MHRPGPRQRLRRHPARGRGLAPASLRNRRVTNRRRARLKRRADDRPPGVRGARGSRYGPVAVRAARAPGAAVGQRGRRSPPSARDRARAFADVHGHDRGGGKRGRAASASAATPCATSRSLCCWCSASACWHRRCRTGSRRRCRGWRASDPRRAATASAPGCWWEARSGSSTRPAPRRSWRR